MKAPELFGVHHDERGLAHCFVKKQPSTEPELRDMCRAIAGAELACIHYRGNDPEVLNRLTEMGESAQCDQIPDEKWWQFFADLIRSILGHPLR